MNHTLEQVREYVEGGAPIPRGVGGKYYVPLIDGTLRGPWPTRESATRWRDHVLVSWREMLNEMEHAR